MRRLRSAEREVLLLRAAGELSLNEIAIVTRSSVAAVKMRLHRARSRLTELLALAPDEVAVPDVFRAIGAAVGVAVVIEGRVERPPATVKFTNAHTFVGFHPGSRAVRASPAR